MSRPRPKNLEEARNTGEFDRFCKEHPSKGDKRRFDALLDAMSKSSPEAGQTSGAEPSEGCSETQTPPDTSKDADG